MKVYLKPTLKEKISPDEEAGSFKATLGMLLPERVTLVQDTVSEIIKKNGSHQLSQLFEIVCGVPGGTLPKNLSKEETEKRILQTIDNIFKSGDGDLLKEIYDAIYKISGDAIDVNDIDIYNTLQFEKLTILSRKRVIAHELKKMFPDTIKGNKEKRKKILWELANIQGVINRHSFDLLGMNPILTQAQTLFTGSIDQHIGTIINNFLTEMCQDERQMTIELLEIGGVSSSIVDKFKNAIGRKGSSQIIGTGAKLNQELFETDENLPPIDKQNRSSMSDFNPIAIELDLPTGLKFFSESRLKELYKEFFYKIASKILITNGGVEPRTNSLIRLEKKQLKENEESKESEDKLVYQFLLEWEIGDNFDEEDLENIIELMRDIGYNLNASQMPQTKGLAYPRTRPGMCEFKGHLSESGDSRAENHAVIVTEKQSKTRDLRLGLSEITQDDYTYLMVQIGHYITHRKFIDKQQLFFKLYHEYNLMSNGENHSYDISVFERQYDAFMRKVIIPYSIEGKELDLPTDNVLLSGIYGSGKSQFLLQLLTKKVFSYKGKEVHLNANVINIDLQTFKAMLTNGLGGFRTRLDEIYQNTGVGIILVIEDIDTIINEKLHSANDEIAQAMTLFFEGIGSIPVKIVTTANDPSKLSERLVRPNRLYEIIEFYLPTEEQKVKIFNQHLEKNNIQIDNQTLRQKIYETNVFKKGTASHIGKFVEELYATIQLSKHFGGGEDIVLSDDEILEVANNINISAKDIEDTIASIEEWVQVVTGRKPDKLPMGFTGDKY